MSEATFANGLYWKEPKENAPDWVKGNISIKVEDFIPFLEEQQEGWVNLVVKKSKGGKYYAQLDNWKPSE